MFGFVFGTLCLLGFFALKMSARRHHYRRFRGRGRGRGRGRSMFGFASSEWVKRRLDLDEDQGDLAEHAVKDIQRSVRTFFDAAKDARSELGTLVRGDAIDDAALEVVFDRLDDDLSRARREVVSAVKQIHGTLDREQRERLADLIGGPAPSDARMV